MTLTEETEQQIVKYLLMGQSRRELCRVFDISDWTMRTLVKKHDIPAAKPGRRPKLGTAVRKLISERYARGESQPKLAREFEVDIKLIRAAIRENGVLIRRPGGKPIPDNIRRQVREAHANGLSYPVISDMYGLNRRTVGVIVNEESRED